MKPGDKVKIKRGPLSGMVITLKRHDNSNRCWHGSISVGDHLAEAVMVYDYELVDVVEQKVKNKA